MASVVIAGDTSGSVTVAAPAVAGSNTQTLVAATGTLAPLIADTAKSATGTAVDFTGIPSWVKRITVNFSGVSTNGTSGFGVQLGDSGGFETTNYSGTTARIVTATAASIGSLSTMFRWVPNSAALAVEGSFSISLTTSNTWTGFGIVGSNDTIVFCAGTKVLSDTLTQLRITTVNGTDTFDAGTINILYEG